MKYVKTIGKFAKAKFMSSTDEQATVAILLVVFLLVVLAVA